MFNSSSSQISVHQLAGKWQAEYLTDLKELFIGEGDFGYSCSQVKSHRNSSKIVATSFQTYDDIITMYKKAEQHIGNLLDSGAMVLFNVDARTMQYDERLIGERFDRITFNFPHAGFLGAETDRRVIAAHRALMRSFFENATTLLSPQGEVHVTHQTNYPYNEWNLPQLANEAGLEHFDTCAFHIEDYLGYENKRGAGRYADKPFKLRESAKFKFKIP